MSAFDKLQQYSARKSAVTTQDDIVAHFFDTKTPEGYFLNRLHSLGYKVAEVVYKKGESVISEKEYKKLDDKVGYTREERLTEFAKMLTTDGNILTIASAGSGKTTALIFRIMRDILTGEAVKPVTIGDGSTVKTVDNIFVGTFLKSGAEDLKNKLSAWQRKLGYTCTADRIQFGTLHAEFKRALNAMGVDTRIGSPELINKCLKTAIHSAGVQREDCRPLTFEDYRTIEGIVTSYRNFLDNQKYEHPACKEYNLTPTILDYLVTSFANERAKEGVMDFEDLQELLYKYLYITPNPAIQDFISNRYNYIYLDEFQDTSQIQYAILKFYMRGKLWYNRNGEACPPEEPDGLYTGVGTKGKVVAIGDDDQSIYRWRGSDIDIIVKDFPKDISPTILKLSVNYRCPDNILNPVKTSIMKNMNRYPKTLLSSKEGGIFHAYHTPQIQTMIEDLLAQIEEDTSQGNSVAIICRTNFDGVIPAMMLEMKDKYQFSISSDAMTLSSAMPKSIVNCARIFTDRTSQYVTNTLVMLASKRDGYMVQDLMKRLKADSAVGKTTWIWDIQQEDYYYSCPSIANIIGKMKRSFIASDGTRIKGGDIEALKVLYFYLMSEIFNGDNAYCQKMRSYIQAVLYILNTEKYNNVGDFLSAMSEYNDMLKARVGKKNMPIKIATVHEFKGKEADCVYVWHDSENLYPASKANLAIQADLEEERRVHYIACTRARKKCIIYALKAQHGLFFDELDTKVEDLYVKRSGTISSPNKNNSIDSEIDALLERVSATQQNDSVGVETE